MALYFLRISDGKHSISSEVNDIDDRQGAWTEMTKVCGDLIGGVSRGLKQNGEWQIELLDLSATPVFRIRLVAETLD
jgi:hypothetical protein